MDLILKKAKELKDLDFVLSISSDNRPKKVTKEEAEKITEEDDFKYDKKKNIVAPRSFFKKLKVKIELVTAEGKKLCYEGIEEIKRCTTKGKLCNVKTGRCRSGDVIKKKVEDRGEVFKNIDGLAGEFSEVDRIAKELGFVREPKVIKPVRKQAKRCYDEDEDCDEGKLCSGETGRCVKDTTIRRKELQSDIATLKTSDGRIIYGRYETLERLMKELPGSKIADMRETKEEKLPEFARLSLKESSLKEKEISEDEDEEEPVLKVSSLRKLKLEEEKVKVRISRGKQLLVPPSAVVPAEVLVSRDIAAKAFLQCLQKLS